MEEIYFSRWKVVLRSVVILLCALGYIGLFFITPSDHPVMPIALEYFLAVVCIMGGVVMLYVVWFMAFTYLWCAITNRPIVIITNDNLQIYDMSVKHYFVLPWNDITKIERFEYKSQEVFDVYLHDSDLYLLQEPSRFRRLILKLNAFSMRGAATRIPANDLAVDSDWLFNELQSHL